jgi:hypothetical protein
VLWPERGNCLGPLVDPSVSVGKLCLRSLGGPGFNTMLRTTMLCGLVVQATGCTNILISGSAAKGGDSMIGYNADSNGLHGAVREHLSNSDSCMTCCLAATSFPRADWLANRLCRFHIGRQVSMARMTSAKSSLGISVGSSARSLKRRAPTT